MLTRHNLDLERIIFGLSAELIASREFSPKNLVPQASVVNASSLESTVSLPSRNRAIILEFGRHREIMSAAMLPLGSLMMVLRSRSPNCAYILFRISFRRKYRHVDAYFALKK